MRLVVADIDDFAVTPADLSDVGFEGSPEAVRVSTSELPPVEVKPTGEDEHFDLSEIACAPERVYVEWETGSASFDLVKRHYCSISDVANWGKEKARNASKREKTDMELFHARALAEYVAEAIMGRTFRETLREDFNVRADGRLAQLEWPASRVLTAGWQLFGDGLVRFHRGCRHQSSATVTYIAGNDERIPLDVRQAVTRLAASYLMPSSIPDRASAESTDSGGYIRYTLATEESTGIPDVDAALLRYARSRQVVL